jgi:hypothetical protein
MARNKSDETKQIDPNPHRSIYLYAAEAELLAQGYSLADRARILVILLRLYEHT